MNRLLVFILLICQGMAAQAVVFLEINDTLQKPKYQEFIYLNDATDISESVRVGTLKSVGSLDNPVLLYTMIKNAAQKVGANSFKLVQFDKFPDQTGELTLETFYTNDSILGVNFENIQKNKIYVFGDEDMTQTDAQSYKVDGVKRDIKAGHFAVYNLKIGQELKFTKGGFTGETIWVKGEEGQTAKFYSLAGMGLNGVTGDGHSAEVSISTGDIKRVEQNLALLLLKMFEQQN